MGVDWCLFVVYNSGAKGVNQMRLSVTVDPKLLEVAKSVAGLRTKREVIEVALREMILHRRLQDLANLEGSGLIETDLEQLIQWQEAGKEL